MCRDKTCSSIFRLLESFSNLMQFKKIYCVYFQTYSNAETETGPHHASVVNFRGKSEYSKHIKDKKLQCYYQDLYILYKK